MKREKQIYLKAYMKIVHRTVLFPGYLDKYVVSDLLR